MHGSRTTRRATALTLLVGLLLVLVPAAVHADGSAEAAMTATINAERAAHGLPALDVDGQLTEVARRWTAQMMAAGGISHRPDLRAAIAGDPALIGENVGRSHVTGASQGELVDRLHRAFMESPGHRANVLGDWTHIGIGVGLSQGGEEMWVTVNFTRVRAPQPDAPVEVAAAPSGAAEPEPATDASAADDAGGHAPAGTPADAAVATATEAADPGEPTAPFAALSPSIRAYFALHDPPLLPRHFAGYVTAV